MKHVLSILALAASSFVAAGAAQAQAQPESNRAVMSGPAESPPNNSPGVSISTVEVNGMTLRVEVPFRDLVSPTLASHIHCCTASPLTGTAPIALPFTDFPTGVTAGSYTKAFDLTSATVFEPTFLSGNGGNAAGARTALLNGIAANEAYVNIHTERFPAGEIRGFLVAAPVPEPSTWAMLGIGLAGLSFMARRRT
jgi:hypothetical protein